MSIGLMKLTDEYIGRIIVFFISILKTKPNLERKLNSNTVQNILFIKFWGIGSIVLATPSIEKVKKAYTDSRIYFLTLKNNLEICNEISPINETFSICISNPFILVTDFLKVIRKLRGISFDLIFDFEFYTYFSAIITALIKSQSSYGFNNLKNNRKTLFSKSVLFNNQIHTRDNFLNLVSAESKVSSINTYTGFTEFLPSYNYSKCDLRIIINTNASNLAYERRLPEKAFVSLIDKLTETFNCRIVLTGLQNEIIYVASIYECLRNKNRIDNLCGKTSLRELILLLKTSVCLITNDSGPLHLASALNVPVVAFFGPESPLRYGPLSDKQLVFYNNLKCSPCMSISNSKTVNCIFDSPICMEQFVIKEVSEKISVFIRNVLSLKENNIFNAQELFAKNL